jgi:signal peptidase I
MESEIYAASSPSGSWFEVYGNCMAPLLRKGDFVKAGAIDDLRIGDIVIVSGSPHLVHRVVRVDKENRVITKGDMNLTFDPPLTRDNLAGKVSTIFRKGSEPILIKGRRWQIENYLIARFSMACIWIWDLATRQVWLGGILRRFAAPMSLIYISLIKVMIRFTLI